MALLFFALLVGANAHVHVRGRSEPLLIEVSDEPHDDHHDGDHAEHDDHGHSDHGDDTTTHATAGHGDDHAEAGHDDHGDHGHGDATKSAGGASVAVGLFATTILIPFVFTMVQYGGVVTKLMWKFIDFFVSVFLAILWFGAFSDILSLDFIKELASPLILVVAQVFVLYALALGVAYLFAGQEFRLVTFGSCAAHYVAFAGIAAGEHAQREHFADETWHTFVFVFIAFAVFACVFGAVHKCWRQSTEPKEEEHTAGGKKKHPMTVYNHVIDELELDIGALVTSYLITQSVRTALSGHYPAAHLLLQAHSPDNDAFSFVHGESAHATHTLSERLFMFAYALVLVVSCVSVVPKLHKWGHTGHYQHKIAHFIKVLLIMCAAWGFLLWGEWEFATHFHADPLFGHMVFALLATMVCLFVLLACGYFIPVDRKDDVHDLLGAAEIGCTGLALTCAFSWEHCFHVALDIVGQEYQVGYGGLIPKITLAVLVPCFVLPVYVNFIKPKVIQIEEDDEAHAEAHDDHH